MIFVNENENVEKRENNEFVNENEKMIKTKTKLKRKCQNSKTCHSTKVPAYNTPFNTALTGAYYDRTPYGIESVTNGSKSQFEIHVISKLVDLGH